MERADLEQWKAREVARLLALVETQRRYYQEIVASIPVGLMVLSADLGILLANGAARQIFGLRRDSLQHRLDTLLPGGVLDRVEEVLKSGTPETGILVETERENKRRLRIGILAIRNWDNEAAPEALLTIEDLTGLGAAPPTARPASNQAPVISPSELIDQVEAVIWAVELSSLRFVYVSPEAERLFGFPREHWTANVSFFTDRALAADRDWLAQSAGRAVEKGEGYSGEFRAPASDGRILCLRESARVLPDSEGRPNFLIGVTVDVTERRLLEEQLVQSERVEAVTRLASRMAHDLNNVLMILTGYGEELLNSIPPGNALRADVQEILNATERMSGLTSQLLAFTRKAGAAAGSFDLEPALSAWGQRTGAVGLEFKLSSETNHVRANDAELEHAVAAIIDRARQAMAGSGTIGIQTSRMEISEEARQRNAPLEPGAYAVIAISAPIPTPQGDARASLFECFLPGKEPWDATAAAMSRAYGMVRQWGGDISVAPGVEGSIFRVFLPLVEPTEAPVAPAPEPEPKSLATILVVEDEAGIRALVRKILRRQGYDVLEAANGEEALAVCAEHGAAIDLLVTDVIMPQMGGQQLVNRLHEQGRDMKVLYVSGYSDDPAIYARELPAGTAFLQKPFTLGALLDKVKEVLTAYQ
jgi:two-component system cell cycle sensor histidine kinase/response regulator CckA